MKLLITTLLVLVSANLVLAQTNTFPSSGNVGIGTAGPTSLLQINGVGANRGIQIDPNDHGYILTSYNTSAGGPEQFNIKHHLGNVEILNSRGSLNLQPNSGNVGIGTTAPTDKLNVLVGSTSTQAVTGIKVGGPDNYPSIELGIAEGGSYDGIIRSYGNDLRMYAGHWRTTGTTATEDHSLKFYTSKNGSADWSTPKMLLDANGRLGIGVTPSVPLHVASTSSSGEVSRIVGSLGHGFHFKVDGNAPYVQTLWVGGGESMAFSTSGAEALRISTNGNIGIGTAYPQSKLAVNGDIYAKKVKVTQTGWADFVFEKDYVLKPLSEVENYIKQNKHLPEVPSAEEVAKNDLDLGEMNKILLMKVEELTLYMIELKRENETLKKVNETVMGRIEKIEKEIAE